MNAIDKLFGELLGIGDSHPVDKFEELWEIQDRLKEIERGMITGDIGDVEIEIKIRVSSRKEMKNMNREEKDTGDLQ